MSDQAEEIKRLTAERDKLAATLRKLQAQRDGKLLDALWCCKVCDGELPDGHVDNCEVWAIEKKHQDFIAGPYNKALLERDAWRKLVVEHNTLRSAQCRNCREPCGDCCPATYVLPIPPELEQSP